MATRKGGLGRGLDALIPTSVIPQDITTPSGVVVADRNEIDINLISPNPKQPRTVFDEEQLAELALSIKEVGLLQPPVVRSIGNGKYQLIMGERRFRAAKLAGLRSIPVIIRQTPDNELLREALIENIHRSQLNPLEEAAAYTQLLQDFNCTHDELAQKLGRSRPLISNTMRLLNLPASVQSRVASGVISAGHARALLGLSNEAEIDRLAKRIVAEGLSVRAVEEIIAATSPKSSGKAKKKSSGTSPEVNEIAEELGDHLDTRVKIKGGKTKGEISIEFSGYADLARIVKKIKG